jgi:carotenoid cleavage dioxygenase
MQDENNFDRRSFMKGAVGTAAGAVALAAGSTALAAEGPPPLNPARPAQGPGSAGQFSPIRAEVQISDCEIEGKLPTDLSGGFYATGPDTQYPPMQAGNIIFDGEGHVRLFRIRNGRVDYRTRYARTERYVAQDKARRKLFPMYRNPYLDDPSVKGLSRSTANTHVINHKGLILALKEDSPPCALDLNTLETVDPVYTFGGQLPRTQPFTAHPKVDSHTGNIVAFGYEADGYGTPAISVYELEKATGRKLWEARIAQPQVGMLHDFAVTENHVCFYSVPLTYDAEQVKRGGIHWSWDRTGKTYFGWFRRGGDGKDLKWIEGPAQSGTHTMGVFEDKGRIYLDTERTAGNPFPFMPNRDGGPPDFKGAASFLHRISANLSGKNKGYNLEPLFPLSAPLPRQDDRYNTVAYRYGFAACPDPNAAPGAAAGNCYARMDIQTKTFKVWNAGTRVSLAEPVFAPKNLKAREGEGYLLGVGYNLDENGRSDLLVFDAERIEEGPVAKVRLPVQASPQVHGWWVREDQYPG